MDSNQIIAVWGSPSSGKTVTSIKIARELSLKKKNVIVVFCDTLAPDLMTVLPHVSIKDKSLGSILSAPEITQKNILKKCITVNKNEYISLIGYMKGENCFTYPDYSKERAVDFIILLRHLADYVIFDCLSFFTSDVLSTAALELSDKVIRLSCCNLKAVPYYESMLPLLQDRKFNANRHIKVLSKFRGKEPRELIAEEVGGVQHELPFVEELEEQHITGELFKPLVSKQSKKYRQSIQRLINSVFDGQLQPRETQKDIKKKENNKDRTSFIQRLFAGLRGGRT